MLKFFGISLPVVQVSGGLALAAMGWKLLNQEEPDEKEKLPDMDGPDMRSLEQKVFYPFTFPITAGPVCVEVRDKPMCSRFLKACQRINKASWLGRLSSRHDNAQPRSRWYSPWLISGFR